MRSVLIAIYELRANEVFVIGECSYLWRYARKYLFRASITHVRMA